MIVPLMYGRAYKSINVPNDALVISVYKAHPLENDVQAIQEAILRPIGDKSIRALTSKVKRVTIAHSDITRATPNERILPVLLNELESAGANRKNITLINALGTHRAQTEAELRQMLGEGVFRQYRCEQHNAFDDEKLVSVGWTQNGHPTRLNRTFMDADLKILVGFIEPHFFAGFSGGPKGVLPALAGAESVFSNHGKELISSPKATWGITYGNPIWEEMLETALKVKDLFLLNVSLNPDKRITGVFAGNLEDAHCAGCDLVRRHSFVDVDEHFDVVITTNSGYPLDQNLYQCVKGMSAAGRIVRDGGAILMIAACEDGIPEHGSYAQLLKTAGSPRNALLMIDQQGFQMQDQWQVQIQATIQKKADVYVFSEGLTPDQIQDCLFLPSSDLQQDVNQLIEKYGPKVCVMPQGPMAVPSLR